MYELKFSPFSMDLEIRIPEGKIWWDDGYPGGGDWIVAHRLNDRDITTELLVELGIPEVDIDKLILGKVKSIALSNRKTEAYLKSNLKPGEYWADNTSFPILQAKYQRRPCPKCGELLELEPDQTYPYCSNCEKNVEVDTLL